jgi:hypothetical protein
VYTDPEYRRLVDALLDEIKALSEPVDPGMCDRSAYIFVASPGSITPYHMDRDINYLLQFRGKKKISIWDPRDRTVLPDQGLETLFAKPDMPRPTYEDSFQSRAYEFELEPGKAVHHPFTAPHWVKNGDAVSISMSVTFRTASSHRRMRIHKTNYYLRKLGLEPAALGASPLRDAIKSGVYRAYTRAKGILSRHQGHA